MISFSRRQLAAYAVEQMIKGRPMAALARELAAGLIVLGRHKELELILADIDQELEDRDLLAQVRVTSAYPLSDKLKTELTSQIKKLTNVKNVDLTHRLDKEVLGGIKIETANHTWDKTLRKTLTDIKESV
ncbi:MAG TPA: F0F1 ATP synthase subunit delta [Candidatus Saccharimonadales bacterium]|nr:F0F1 ATP synthase subunit delta [Candidatus Saccharimonadales bacterium]